MSDIDDNWDDSPLESSGGDELGHGKIADSIAKCILSINKTKGGVIAIRGPWGSGKSSIINMVLAQFTKDDPKSPIKIQFNSWCYRNEDEIVAGFFQELYAGLKSNVDNKQTDLRSLAKLGARIVGVTKVVASGLKVAAPSADALISVGQNLLENAIAQDKSIDSLQKDVSDIIGKINRKILFVIDDIDRLSPDEAIAIFRVIKSVGRLDNVIYLLSYDRIATEGALEEKYPSERGRYLDKIIQASFDLPQPSIPQLDKILMSRFNKIFENSLSGEFSYTDTAVRDIIISVVGTPRGVHQLANAISVTFSSVEKNVNIDDFIVIEVLRLFRPNVYQKIKENKNILLKPKEYGKDDDPQFQDTTLEDVLLIEESEADRSKLSYLLNNLFPLMSNDLSDPDVLNREKRVCSSSHFDTYFRFSVSSEAVSYEELCEFVANAGNRDFVKEKLVGNTSGSYSESKVISLIDQISNDINKFNHADIEPFLVTLYSVSNQIQKSTKFSDMYRQQSSARDRIAELSIKLLESLKDNKKISEIIFEICEDSPLDLISELCEILLYRSRYGNSNAKQQFGKYFMKMEDVRKLSKAIQDRILKSASENKISDFGNLYRLLVSWDSISDDREKIKSTFRCILDQSAENVIVAANGFGMFFSGEKDDRYKNYRYIRRVNKVIYVTHFLVKLFEVTKDESVQRVDREEAKKIFKIFNEYDERYSSLAR